MPESQWLCDLKNKTVPLLTQLFVHVGYEWKSEDKDDPIPNWYAAYSVYWQYTKDRLATVLRSDFCVKKVRNVWLNNETFTTDKVY